MRLSSHRAGFTLLELMIVVVILGALASISIPIFQSYQLKAKSAEAKSNLAAIRLVEESYFTEFEVYLGVTPEPVAIPGAQPVVFNAPASGFATLGFAPEGIVYFSYGVGVAADGLAYTADAGADIDGNGVVQFWGYGRPDLSGALVPGQVGCPIATLTPSLVGPCTTTAGQSVF